MINLIPYSGISFKNKVTTTVGLPPGSESQV